MGLFWFEEAVGAAPDGGRRKWPSSKNGGIHPFKRTFMGFV